MMKELKKKILKKEVRLEEVVVEMKMMMKNLLLFHDHLMSHPNQIIAVDHQMMKIGF